MNKLTKKELFNKCEELNIMNYKSKNKDILKTKSFIYRENNKEKRSNVFKIWYELNKNNLNKKRVEYRKTI